MYFFYLQSDEPLLTSLYHNNLFVPPTVLYNQYFQFLLRETENNGYAKFFEEQNIIMVFSKVENYWEGLQVRGGL